MNDQPDNHSPTPLFDDIQVVATTQNTTAESATAESTTAESTTPNMIWLDEEWPGIPEALRWMMYQAIVSAINDGTLLGLIVRREPLRLKVLTPDNGVRRRTFQHVVLQRSPNLIMTLDGLYAAVAREHHLQSRGKFLTAKLAAELGAEDFVAMVAASRQITSATALTSKNKRSRAGRKRSGTAGTSRPDRPE